MQLQGAAEASFPSFCLRFCGCQAVLRGVECLPRFTNFFQFEERLDFFRTLCRLEKNEAQDSRRERVISGCSAISSRAARIVGVSGSIVGFFGAEINRVIVTVLFRSPRNIFSRTKAASGSHPF